MMSMAENIQEFREWMRDVKKIDVRKYTKWERFQFYLMWYFRLFKQACTGDTADKIRGMRAGDSLTW